MSSLRGGMVTITLVVCAGLAAAAHTGLAAAPAVMTRIPP